MEHRKSFRENIKYIRNQKRYVFYSKAKRKVYKIRNTVARFRTFLKLIFIIVIFLFITYVYKASPWYLPADIFMTFPNNNLEIEGNNITSYDKILAKLQGVKLKRKPIYLLNTKPLEDNVSKIASIDKVFIRRFWFPARLKVVVYEKNPVLSISTNIKVPPEAIIADDGTIIGKEFFPLNFNGNIYSLITYDDYTKWSSKHVHFLLHLAKLIEKVTCENIQYIDIRNPDDVYVQLESINLRIGELNKSVFDRAKLAGSVIPKVQQYKKNIKYIDLRWEDAPSIKLEGDVKKQLIKDF